MWQLCVHSRWCPACIVSLCTDILPQPRTCAEHASCRADPAETCGSVLASTPDGFTRIRQHATVLLRPIRTPRHIPVPPHKSLSLSHCTRMSKEHPFQAAPPAPSPPHHTLCNASRLLPLSTLPLPTAPPCAWPCHVLPSSCSYSGPQSSAAPSRRCALVVRPQVAQWRAWPPFQLPTNRASYGTRWPVRVPYQPHPHGHVEQQRARNQRRQGLAGTAGMGRHNAIHNQ